jgi:AbrB family looped-hinge helix DNA binding protein
MRTKVSTKGQVVIPRPIRDKLELQPGDVLKTSIENDRIVLVPARKRSRKPRIVHSRVSGFPVISLGKNAPRLTSKQVADLLTEFP